MVQHRNGHAEVLSQSCVVSLAALRLMSKLSRATRLRLLRHGTSLYVKRNRQSLEHPVLSKLIQMLCNQELNFKNYFRESQRLDFACHVDP